MAGTTTLSPPPPFPPITTTGNHYCSSTSKLCAKFSYPSSSLRRPFRRNPRISICRRGKLNNSRSEESQDVSDHGFFFDGGDLVEEDDETDDEEDGEETEESSVDLLVRFLQSMVKKISRRAKKASRSVLPPAISTQLVSFAVDGLLILASLSIVKALLEVVCALGGTVFVAILLIRVIWATLSYFQTNGSNFNQGGSSYGTAQPVT